MRQNGRMQAPQKLCCSTEILTNFNLQDQVVDKITFSLVHAIHDLPLPERLNRCLRFNSPKDFACSNT